MSPTKRFRPQAVQFSQFGGVDVLEIVDVPVPTAGHGEVVVEVLAAGINHIEAYIRQGLYTEGEIPVRFPQTQGTDFAGLVIEVGPGVTSFARGAEVLGHAPMNAHATVIAVPANYVVAKPPALSWEIAGSIFLAGLAAEEAVTTVHVSENETLVTSAAAGGVGSIVAQLAMRRGATVIGTCGERNFDYLRQIGVKPVVYGDGLADRIRALAPRGVDAYIDNFGKNDRSVAEELGVSSRRFWSSDQRKEVEMKAQRPTVDEGVQHTRTLAQLAGMAADRSIDILISGFYPFARVRDAFDDLEKRHARGKIVLGMRPVDNEFHGFRLGKMRDAQERLA
jgi:NADPH:quinone reductase-like Zn-dependent oxidoreductase